MISVDGINYAEFKHCIIDEVVIRKSVNGDTSDTKETWTENDTQLLGQFHDNLDAGNVENFGVKIIGFKLKRREKNNMDSIVTLGTIYYEDGDPENKTFEFIDCTQPSKDLVYSFLPIGENGLIGTAKEIEFESDFTGWWITDKDTNLVLGFDKAIGSVGDLDVSLDQDRTVIDTLSKHSQVYYGEKENHSFTLTGAFIPDDGQKGSDVYNNILNNFIRQHKPFVAKNGNGLIFIVDVSNLKSSSPINTWKGYDVLTATVECLEIMEMSDYMAENE